MYLYIIMLIGVNQCLLKGKVQHIFIRYIKNYNHSNISYHNNIHFQPKKHSNVQARNLIICLQFFFFYFPVNISIYRCSVFEHTEDDGKRGGSKRTDMWSECSRTDGNTWKHDHFSQAHCSQVMLYRLMDRSEGIGKETLKFSLI